MSSHHSWLPLALPAHARRIRADPPDTMEVLRAAGAELVAHDPDVEIAAAASSLHRDAPHAILSLGMNQPDGGGRLLRARRRAGASLRVRAASLLATSRLRTMGYRDVRSIPWDFDQPVRLPSGADAPRRRIAELLPERALVTGHRDGPAETLLEAAMAEAAVAVGQPMTSGRPLVRAGVLVIVADTHVIRVAVGPAGQRLRTQQEVIAQLSGADPVIADRLPAPILTGRVGLGDWSAEPRLHGAAVSGDIPEPLLWECMEFLAALHDVDASGPGRPLADDARRCAEICPEPEQRRELIALGEELDALLADVPRGFGHGDFWVENLLCEDGHLSGVIDWDGGGPGRLPLLDLIHLQVSDYRDGRHLSIGDAIVASQLEVARGGGDEVTRAYCRRIGLDPDARILEALVLAFWIDRAALELDLRPDTVTPIWVQEHITTVLDHLRRDGRLTGM